MHKTFKEANSTNINHFYWDCKLLYKKEFVIFFGTYSISGTQSHKNLVSNAEKCPDYP